MRVAYNPIREDRKTVEESQDYKFRYRGASDTLAGI